MNRKLGRGLDILIPNRVGTTERKQEILTIPPVEIAANPYQPRKDFNKAELAELAASVKKDGVLQPVLVRRTSRGYQLISGERRLRASKLAGLEMIPAIVIEADDRKAHELALIENLQRQDLNPIEEAQGIQNLIALYGLTQAELAEALGKKRSTIANTLRLLELPEDILSAIETKKITTGHAKVLLSVSNKTKQKDAFKKILNNKLSVRALEEMIANDELEGEPEHEHEQDNDSGTKRSKKLIPAVKAVQDELTRVLGTKVKIKSTGKRGAITIHFYSVEEFERLRTKLKTPDVYTPDEK